MNPLVLVIDDEPDLRELVRDLLQERGYDIAEAGDGSRGLRELFDRRPAAVVLDLSMPGVDGWQTLERIRELSDVPVLILSSRGGDLEKVRGLRTGADDYLVKPFFPEELVARVEALLRRSQPSAGARESYEDGALEIDYLEHRVSVAGEPITLTPLEFRLLCQFVDHPRQVLSHDQLLERVWHDPQGVAPDQVRLYVGYLRRKLGSQRDRIETVRGFGYRYTPPGATRQQSSGDTGG